MDDLEIGRYTIPAAELEEFFDTSGGPGGQHANRSETAVRLRFDIAGSSLPDDVRKNLEDRLGETIDVTASDSRSQFHNRALARKRLKQKIEDALLETPQRRVTRPTRASRKRRADEKRARAETKRLRRQPEVDE